MDQSKYYDYRNRVLQTWGQGQEEGLAKVLAEDPELMGKWLSEHPRMLSIALSVASTDIMGDKANPQAKDTFAKFLAGEPALLARVMSLMAP